mmetsp:Transcript_13289/g.18136  ORF Transcript_13289/g.18136 Transcript_13289/m.18136 type:complete len:118 (+) Transcript_13289:94-447(+)|eukprot:CAMPEP_0196570802 /NCGR_PEP_ID=MMETSP1081-20130531/977_1 /TAXON_ID=36882 /ORGANISM="Pyramimonas amylifera, Strain CCMP720" /LENGTH=117 /DNA_ID=CAMNT_0041887469 /DNA_START=77 /DNA_END=430 /DNA_ORIENTATION=-
MAAITSRVCVVPVASNGQASRTTRAPAPRAVGVKAAAGLSALLKKPTVSETFARTSRKVTSRRTAALKTSASMEIMEVANMGAEIASVAVTCSVITLVGLAVGFVLLRVEAIVEESN